MASYVYRVHVVLHPGEAPIFPDEAFDLCRETILFKCERKAKKFVQKTLDGYSKTGDFKLWQSDKDTWNLDSKVSSARLTFMIEECRIRT